MDFCTYTLQALFSMIIHNGLLFLEKACVILSFFLIIKLTHAHCWSKEREGKEGKIHKIKERKWIYCNPPTECYCYKYVLLQTFFYEHMFYSTNWDHSVCTTLFVHVTTAYFHATKILTCITKLQIISLCKLISYFNPFLGHLKCLSTI